MASLSICGILIVNLFSFNDSSSPYELFSIGCQLELEGKVPEAINYYLEALKKDPGGLEIYLSLTNAYYKLREFDKGIEYAYKGLAIAKDSSEFYGIIAAGYIGKGDLKSAINTYKRIIELTPSETGIILTVSLLYEGLGDLNSSMKVLLEFPDSLKNVDIYNRLGTLAGKLHNHSDAINYFKKAIVLDTTNFNSLIGAGTGFDILNVKDSAIFYYELAAKYNPTIELRKRLIDLYGDTEQYKKLVTVAKEILNNNYYDAFVRRSLGFALYKLGYFVEALNEFLISAGLNPDDDYSRFYIARINLEQREYDKAQKAIEEAIRINPDFVELWIYAGFIALDKKDYKNARYYFSEAAYRNADMSQIYYLLGATCEMDSAFKDAYFYYKKSVSLNPASLAGLSALANLCDRMEMKEEALRVFEKVIEIDSTNAMALNYVGYTYAENGKNLDSALKLIERALAIEPNNGYIIDSRGWVYYQQGDYESALIDLKRANELVEDVVILEHLGDLYLKLNEIKAAIDIYKKALNIEPTNKRVKEKLLKLKGK